MTRKEVAASLIALFALAGCVSVRPNPERRACSTQCVEVKNSCMVAAGSAEAVTGCDAEHRSCMAPCLAMPSHLTNP
jgi:hypothetical protein